MNSFADELEVLWPKMQKQAEKYPELKGGGEMPEELKELQKESTEMGMSMAGTFMKIGPYMRDSEVMKAQERIGKIMTE